MDTFWRHLLWRQFGAAIDMLDNALIACTDSLWHQPVWQDPSVSPRRAEFWYVAYHALFWLDLYLFGSEEGFAPPAPYSLVEQDNANGPLPDRDYSKDEVRAYLAHARQRCRTTIATMTDERAHQPVSFPWMREGDVVSYLELQLYNMRHVQEHTAQLSLLLGQHGIHADEIDWLTRAEDDPGSNEERAL